MDSNFIYLAIVGACRIILDTHNLADACTKNCSSTHSGQK
uniref:Uncharacterized protein n=1 Tax=Arundo donax TaxID=35708 RepID=A0A0A8ZHX8_ARUDO